MIRRLAVLTAVATLGILGFAAPANALGTSRSASASNYIACVYDGAPLHIGLCISAPV